MVERAPQRASSFWSYDPIDFDLCRLLKLYQGSSRIFEKLKQELPIEERIKIVEDIGDSIAVDQKILPLTTTQKAELDRRLDAYEIDQNIGRLATLAVADILRKI